MPAGITEIIHVFRGRTVATCECVAKCDATPRQPDGRRGERPGAQRGERRRRRRGEHPRAPRGEPLGEQPGERRELVQEHGRGKSPGGRVAHGPPVPGVIPSAFPGLGIFRDQAPYLSRSLAVDTTLPKSGRNRRFSRYLKRAKTPENKASARTRSRFFEFRRASLRKVEVGGPVPRETG